MQWFFERFKLEIEDLQQDLRGLELGISKRRIGDFACGWGYTTLGLMLEFQSSECIGVDQFEKNLVLDVPSIQDVNVQFDQVKNIVLDKTDSLNNQGIRKALFQLFNHKRIPEFQKGDIVAGTNLPSDLDFVYCKKLLQNVFEDGYSNSCKGDEGIRKAIHNIVGAVKPGGLICLVEPSGAILMPFLEQAGLEVIHCYRIQRSEINGQRRNLLYKPHYTIYHCSKT